MSKVERKRRWGSNETHSSDRKEELQSKRSKVDDVTSPNVQRKTKKRITLDEEKLKKGKLVIIEEYGDLFKAPPDHSLAHCVAADMRMGSGIAVNFRQKFGRLGELLDQNKYIGDVAVLNEGDRYIYNLITKIYSNGKPKLEDVGLSLAKMRKHCEQNGVKNLSMPRIGCGLDRLNWDDVEMAIEKAFQDLDITITVYDFNPPVGYSSKKHLFRITQGDVSLGHFPCETALLFLTCEDGNISYSNYSLLYHLNLYREFNRRHKKVGGLVHLTSRYNQNLFGLVVKKNERDAFSYRNFEKCLHVLLDVLKQRRIYSVAFESFDNRFKMTKVTSVINHVFEFSKMKFSICKPQ